VGAVCVRVWWCLIVVFRQFVWEGAGLGAGGQCCDGLSVSDGRDDDTVRAVTVFVPVSVHQWRDLQCRFWPLPPCLHDIGSGVVQSGMFGVCGGFVCWLFVWRCELLHFR
jgi:hypothetical protein